MPWCPNCRTQYRDGVTECSDCKTALVDQLNDELIPFFQAEDKRVAERLADFFVYSDLNSAVFYDEENDCYIVAIDPKKQLEAKKLYQAFYFVERERMLKGESDVFSKLEDEQVQEEDEPASAAEANDDETAKGATPTEDKSPFVIIEEEDDPESDLLDDAADEAESDNISSGKSSDDAAASSADSEADDSAGYVMKADRYRDLTGTVWLFAIFGLAGLIFVLLNVLGTLNILTGWLPNTIMAALFIFFLYVAVSTGIRAKKLKAEIAAEEELTKKINEWLANNVTEEFLKQISDENATSEVNYLKQVATIKEMLIKEFGDQNPAYLDRLIEEYYSDSFDKTIE